MKKVLFIDRDGTLIIEPPEDFQVDSLEKLEYVPKVFQALVKISQELDYELVMVTNQDGLGTPSFPEDTFWPAQNKMVKGFENEGVTFSEIIIDSTFPEDNAPTRKPGTALLTHFIKGNYNLEESFVIGDRASDIELAKNLGSKGIQFASKETTIDPDLESTRILTTENWMEIYAFLKAIPRSASIHRKTSETDIQIDLWLDGPPASNIHTGLGFFDHMLEQIARHGGFKLDIQVQGDLHIDEHHTIEDTGLALGTTFLDALGSKKGITRYAFVLPMDECEASVSLDFGGRPWLVWDADFKREKIGDVPTEMFFHFFKSFCDTAKCNMHIKSEGENEHHKIESIFKAFARCLKTAVERQSSNFDVPSSKGIL
jgi:imidazoleglycerol-phosphate dehydratase/histidinol-phosphatase